jgi:drug/metabolite transporter (DMT)-like permease
VVKKGEAVLEAIVASIGYAGGVIIDKIILSVYMVPVRRFIPWLFIWLAVITVFAVYIFGGRYNPSMLQSKYLYLFVLMLLVAFTWNLFYYQGIQREEVHEFELIMLFSPLVTIILAEIFLPSERSISTFIAGSIASLALLASRVEKRHLRLSPYWKQLFVASVLMAVESIIIKKLLAVYDPTVLYLARTTILAIAFLIVYRPKLLQVSKNAFALTIATAFFGVVQMVLKFYGFASVGVMETTLILILGPVLVYMLSSFFFREKLQKKTAVSALVVVACVLYVVLTNGRGH